MFSILVAVVQFAETVVTRSLGAALIGAGVVGTVAAGRWILAAPPDDVACPGGVIAASGRGAQYAQLALALALGLGCVFAGITLWTHS